MRDSLDQAGGAELFAARIADLSDPVGVKHQAVFRLELNRLFKVVGFIESHDAPARR